MRQPFIVFQASPYCIVIVAKETIIYDNFNTALSKNLKQIKTNFQVALWFVNIFRNYFVL